MLRREFLELLGMAKGIGYLHNLGIGLLKSVVWVAGEVGAASLVGPYRINTTWPWFPSQADWTENETPSPGPFPYGDNLYWALTDSGSWTYPFYILKSTDGGETWPEVASTEMDAQWTYWTVRAGQTSHLRITQFGSGRYVNIYDFDMATDTLTLESTSPEALPETEWVYWSHHNHVTGEDYVFTRTNGNKSYLWIYDGASWNTRTEIYTGPVGTTSWQVQAVTDAGGVTHLFLSEQNGTYTVRQLDYCQIAADGTIGALERVYDTTDVPPALDVWRLGRPSIINDTLIFPVHYSGYWFFGTPVSNPTWTLEQSSATGIETQVSADNAYNLPGTDGRLWWVEDTALKSCTFDGTTRGTEETVLDEATDPSFPSVDPQYFMYPTPPVQLGTNQWGFCASLYNDDGDWPHYYWKWTKGSAVVKGVARVS